MAKESLRHCAQRVLGETPKFTTNAEELCASPDVDVVLIANADAYHVEHGILALQNEKYCLIEKPASICLRDINRLIEAEKTSKGKVFVGTMRRYVAAFLDAVEEVGKMERITYARVRDVIGPNATAVSQSGTFPQRFDDFSKEDSSDRANKEANIYERAISKEFGLKVTPQSSRMLRVLGALGTHSLSAMREIIGMPQSVAGAILTLPGIFSVLFRYDNFPVVYESGLSEIPFFDAHIDVASPQKTVGDGFQERKIRKTYEDPYTLELLDLYDCVVNGKTPKAVPRMRKKILNFLG
ncbi:unnamed protein product [Penicillium pancosmium]